MKKVDLEVKERDSCGTAEAKRMRNSGTIPGVFYGGGNKGVLLSVDSLELKKALGRERGNVILNLSFEGKKKTYPAILKDYQSDPLGKGLLHVDFMEIRMDKPIEASVYLELTGTAAGVVEGGIVDQTLREIRVKCLPSDMPESIEYDIEEMQIGDSIKVSDLVLPAKVEILDEMDAAVASVIPPTILKEEPTAEELEAMEEELLEEGAEAEGEAAEGEAAEGEPEEQKEE